MRKAKRRQRCWLYTQAQLFMKFPNATVGQPLTPFELAARKLEESLVAVAWKPPSEAQLRSFAIRAHLACAW